MRERAFPVATKFSHEGFGRAVGEVDDLHLVAILQFGPQRHQFVVDPRGRAMVADVGVHRVGEIDGGRAARQRHDLALGSEDVDFLGKQVALDVLEKLLRVARLGLNLEQALQPAMRLQLRFGDVDLAIGLVQPVRRDARFGDAMHVLRADLRFQRRAERSEQRRVQRLVAVRLRDRDVVLEFARNRLVQAVQYAERRVAGRHVLDDHANAVDVEDLRKTIVLLAHFLVHAVDRLLAAGNRRRDRSPLQPVANRLQDAIHHLAPVAARGLDRFRQHAVARGCRCLNDRSCNSRYSAFRPRRLAIGA